MEIPPASQFDEAMRHYLLPFSRVPSTLLIFIHQPSLDSLPQLACFPLQPLCLWSGLASGFHSLLIVEFYYALNSENTLARCPKRGLHCPGPALEEAQMRSTDMPLKVITGPSCFKRCFLSTSCVQSKVLGTGEATAAQIDGIPSLRASG